MALGAPTWTIEVNPTGSAWVAMTADGDVGVSVRPASPNAGGESVTAAEMSWVVSDPTGAWWPDNPLSTYYPNITEGMKVRMSGTVGTSTTYRFSGTISGITPELIGDVNTGSRITFVATCPLADLANHTLLDRLSESLSYGAHVSTYSNGDDAWDSWPLTDGSSTGAVASANPFGNNAKVVPAASGGGALEFAEIDGESPFGPWNLPMMATFTPGQDGAGADIPVTPVIMCPVTATTSGQVYFAFRTRRQADRVPACAYDAGGNLLWWFEIQASNGNLLFHDEVNVIATDFGYIADGDWHTIVGWCGDAAVPGAAQDTYFILDGGGAAVMTHDTSAIRTIVFGGLMSPKSLGKQTKCMTGDMAMLGIVGANQVGSVETYCASFASTAYNQVTSILNFARKYVTTKSVSTTATTPVLNGPTQGLNALDALSIVSNTVGGVLSVTPGATTTTVAWHARGDNYPATSYGLTITLEEDDMGDPQFERGLTNTPTRCVATTPITEATYVDVAAEASTSHPRRQDAEVVTWSTTATNAYAVAGGIVNATPGATLHLTNITINLSTAVGGQTLATALMAAIPGYTVVRVANQPSVVLGRTYDDYVLVTWSEEWTKDELKMTLALSRVADYPQAKLGSGAGVNQLGAGGTLTVTNGASLGTGTGSLTIASTGALCVTGSSRSWDWNGEVITGTVSGASSPQTLTVTARGQSGTVARTHANGETIDVYQHMQLTY